MAFVHTKTLEEVLTTLPIIEPFDFEVFSSIGEVDYFISTLGFERRSLAFPELFAVNHIQAAHSLYLKYGTNDEDNQTNLTKLLFALWKISPSGVDSLFVDVPEFHSALLIHLRAHLGRTNRVPHVVVDISAAASRAILRTLNALLSLDIRLTILYAEAAIYRPTLEEFRKNKAGWATDEELGLERGISEVSIPPEFSGDHFDNLRDCVILFPAFKRERSVHVLDHVDPSLVRSMDDRVVWIFGIPPEDSNKWRTDAIKSIHNVPVSCHQYAVSTLDYKKTLDVLEKVFREKRLLSKFSISPLGSKCQSLGVALFHYLHPDIRILFAVPKEYGSNHYSDGEGAKWLVSFDTAVLRASLDSIGCISIVD